MNALLLKAIYTIDGIFQCNFLNNLRSPNSSPSNELNIDPTSIISGDGYLWLSMYVCRPHISTRQGQSAIHQIEILSSCHPSLHPPLYVFVVAHINTLDPEPSQLETDVISSGRFIKFPLTSCRFGNRHRKRISRQTIWSSCVIYPIPITEKSVGISWFKSFLSIDWNTCL